MAGTDPTRYRAPIEYSDVRAKYNAVRSFGGGLVALLAVFGLLQGFSAAPYVLVGAGGVTIHALYERLKGTTALTPLLVDATMIGILSVVRGHSASIEGAGFVYIVTGAILLLPLRRAAMVLAYTVAWAIPVALIAPLVAPTNSTAISEVGATLAFAGIVAQLLYATGQALFASERRHREALEAERRAVELKDEFVSMVSHELRTPLTSIGGFADTLRESWATLPPSEVNEFLTIMRGEASHLSNLVEDILVIPRLEVGRLRLEPEDLALRDQSYDIVRVVFAESGVECQVDVPAGVTVRADPNRLRQILRNLLENARKYGGDQVLIGGEQLGDSYKIVIADNGPGIPVADRERIFEHFEQAVKGDARSEGVGLGLPIARKLARAMGGDLWFEPRFPTGAQFLFTLQMADTTVEPVSDRAEPPSTPSVAPDITAIR